MDCELLEGLPLDLLHVVAKAAKLIELHKLPQAHKLLRRALPRAASVPQPTALICCHHLLGHIAYLNHEFAIARLHHRFVLQQSFAHDVIVGVASATQNLGLIAASEGDLVEARRQILAALHLYEALDRPSGAQIARANLARLEAV
jgi:hypothetical protein